MYGNKLKILTFISKYGCELLNNSGKYVNIVL